MLQPCFDASLNNSKFITTYSSQRGVVKGSAGIAAHPRGAMTQKKSAGLRWQRSAVEPKLGMATQQSKTTYKVKLKCYETTRPASENLRRGELNKD